MGVGAWVILFGVKSYEGPTNMHLYNFNHDRSSHPPTHRTHTQIRSLSLSLSLLFLFSCYYGLSWQSRYVLSCCLDTPFLYSLIRNFLISLVVCMVKKVSVNVGWAKVGRQPMIILFPTPYIPLTDQLYALGILLFGFTKSKLIQPVLY